MKKVLIIDDDEVFAKTLTDSLPKDKYLVVGATNGEEGLKELEKNRPDIIILDLLMPKMGGLEFLKALKEKEKEGKQTVPILISSQLSKMKDISEGVALGMDVGVKGYIIKASENMDMIIKTIDRILGE